MSRTALLIAALIVPMTACDTEDENTQEPHSAELDPEADELEDAEPDAPRGGGEHRAHLEHGERGYRDISAEICESVSCSETQLQRVKAAVARPEAGERSERPDMSEANASLADAFAGDEFSASDLEAWSALRPARSDHRRLRDTMAELHTTLDAEQRHILADRIESGNLFGHRRGKKHHGAKNEAANGDERRAEHLARKVERSCESLSCTDAQKAELTAIFERTLEGRGSHASKAAERAAAFRAARFEPDALGGTEHHAREHERIIEVHGVLTAEQRGRLAERVREHGPRALMGKGRHHGKRGHHGKHRGKHRGKHELRDDVETPEFG